MPLGLSDFAGSVAVMDTALLLGIGAGRGRRARAPAVARDRAAGGSTPPEGVGESHELPGVGGRGPPPEAPRGPGTHPHVAKASTLPFLRPGRPYKKFPFLLKTHILKKKFESDLVYGKKKSKHVRWIHMERANGSSRKVAFIQKS